MNKGAHQKRRAELLKMDASDLKTLAWRVGLNFKTDASKRNIAAAIIEGEEAVIAASKKAAP